jgi:beta-glucosidase-like glycosyl hydrolase/CubicO group peptidase (beta-lactamase class C family)
MPDIGRKFRKGLLIFFAAMIAGIFIQFSVDKRPVSEQDFIFKPSPPPFLKDSSAWSDSVYLSLSARERISQLFMVAAYPRRGAADINRVTELIQKYRVGGIIFFQGTPEQIAELTKYYQSISQVPLLFAIDGEWGLSMRFENTIQYPRQMMLGAINDDDAIYRMGRDIGKQMKMLGLHINFAPVVDVNNNPANPVINSRSFGEIRENVARKGLLYMKGMQDEGILAVAKHFPGHGDTDSDSHYELPVIKYSYERLDSIELFPFKALIEGGVGGVMTAHLNVLGIDTSRNLPSSLSAIITDSLLKHRLNFRGLVFTDAMTMKGVSDLYEQEVANSMAVAAGNDIILMPGDVEKTIRKVEELIRENKIAVERINASCMKILLAKEWAVSHSKTGVKRYPDQDDLISSDFQITQRKLVEKAITVIRNERNILPLKRLDTLKIASVSLGNTFGNRYGKTLALYTDVDSFHLDGTESLTELTRTLDTLRYYNLVLLSLHGNDLKATKQFGISDELITIADIILYLYPTVLNVFTNPYFLPNLKNYEKSRAIIISYENNALVQDLSAQLVFGGIGAKGKLPVTITEQYGAGAGIKTEGGIRMKYTIPAEEGFDRERFAVIDSLVEDAIDKKAMPGCQVLLARHGKVVMYKSYGYYDYLKTREVRNSDLYDLASITKIVATVPSIMKLEQNRMIDIHAPLSKYLPELDTTNKAKIRIDDVLLHQAGIVSWIPFYISTIEPLYPNQDFAQSRHSKRYPIQVGKHYFVNKHLKYKDNCYSDVFSAQYPVEVARGLYMSPVLIDSVFLTIYASEIDEKPGKYRYSDLGFYLFRRMIERLTRMGMEDFVDSAFYAPLGATTLGYRPLERFDRQNIAPTENDLVFRRQILQGYVHDPGAAMLGGVSGHAGLFSNANDLAKFMQMLMNGGKYGGEQYLDKKLIRQYTSCVACENGNRRGLGFDKPENDTTKNGPTFRGISPESYGHTGFTGTMTWADPETGILYIFLSNRVYPDAVYNKLAEMNVRTNIQKAIYDALEEDVKATENKGVDN